MDDGLLWVHEQALPSAQGALAGSLGPGGDPWQGTQPVKASAQDLPLISPQGSPVAAWYRGKNRESSPQISVENVKWGSVSLFQDQQGGPDAPKAAPGCESESF